MSDLNFEDAQKVLLALMLHKFENNMAEIIFNLNDMARSVSMNLTSLGLEDKYENIICTILQTIEYGVKNHPHIMDFKVSDE